MVTPTRAGIIAAAVASLGRTSPTNTCVSLGARPFSLAVGLPYPNYTDGDGHSYTNVTDLVAAIETGHGAGWVKTHPSLARPGDFLIWSPGRFHISLFTDIIGGRKRSIGAGGPSGKIAYQPGSGGGNPDSTFECALVPPYPEDVRPEPHPVPASNGGVTYPNGWLGLGSRGPKVRALKHALITQYPSYSHGLVESDDLGQFGVAVLKEFQRRAGLRPDGLAGPATFAALHLRW